MSSSLDGLTFPKEPLTVDWKQNVLGIRGDRRVIRSGYWDLEMGFPILTVDEYDFFFGRMETGSFMTLVTTAPNNQQERTYTGTVIRSVDGQEFDVPGYYMNVRVVFDVAR